jgi:hypothetical protein
MIAIENDESRHVDLCLSTDRSMVRHTNTTTKNQNFNQLLVVFFCFFWGGCGIRHRERDSRRQFCFFVFFFQKNIFFFLSKSPKQVNEVVVSLKKKRKKEKRQSRVSPSLTMACCVCVIRLIHDRWIISPQPSRCSSIIKEKKRKEKEKTPFLFLI